MRHGQSGTVRRSVVSRIVNLPGLSQASPDAPAPSVENLEPRVLLSANPLADALKYQDEGLLNYQPAIIMPLSGGQSNSPSPFGERDATVTILSPLYNTSYNGQVDVKAGIVEGDSAIAKWTVKLINEDTGRTYTLKTGSGLPASELLVSFNSRSYGAGFCRIEVEAVDVSGVAVTASRAFRVDLAAPTVSIASPAASSRQNGVFEVAGSIADADTADELVSWTLSLKSNSTGETFVVAEGLGKKTNESLGTIDPAKFISGDYTLLLEARDTAGNSRSTSRAIKLDGFAPEVAISSDMEEVDARQYVTFTIDATDDIGISSRKLTINGVTYTVGSTGVLRIRMDKAGVFEAIAEVADAAGNIGRATMQITVLDVYKPEVTLNAPANNASIGVATDVYAYIRDYDSPSVNWVLTLTNKTTGAKSVVATGAHTTTGANDRVLLDQIDPARYADGEYLLTVDVVDTAGNTAKSEINLKVDTTVPVIESVTLNQENVETFRPVIFTIAATDNFAVSRYELYINGEKITVAATGKSSSYTFKEAGTYRVEAYAFDAAGNQTVHAFNLAVTETEDLKAPTITLASPGNNAAYNKNIPVTVTIKDADSLIINWTVRLINNATGQGKLLGSGDRETANLVVATLSPGEYADGSYIIVVEAVDKGGNQTVLTRDFSIDTVLPDVSVAPETSRLEVGHTIWFHVSQNDASTISRRTFTVNGKSVSLDANGRGNCIFDSAGEYTLIATVTDAAGNVGTVTRTIVVTANTDFIAPTVEITSPGVHSYNGGMTSVKGIISGSDSENVSWTVQLRYPNGTTVRALGSGTGMVANEELVSFNAASYAAGLYSIEVTAVDPAGNTTLATRAIYIDRSAPTISITGPAANAQVKEPINVTGTLTDKDTPTEYVSWNVTIANSSTGDVFTAVTGTDAPVDGVFGVLNPSLYPSGTYKLIIEAVDAGGNKATVSRNIKIDAVAPEVTISSDVSSIEPGQYVTFTMGATDDIGISTRKLYINGTTYNVGATGVLRVRLSTVGVFEVVAEATDAAGNIGRATMQIAVGVDTVAPVIDSVSIDKSTVETYQPVTFIINASDNYAVTRYEMYINGEKVEVDGYGKTSYMFKSAGTHQVMAYAYDAAGNVTTYESNVFVQATSDTPVVSISHNAPSKVYPGQTVEFIVATTGNVDIESLEFRINGQNVSVGADGRVSYTFTELGIYSIETIATNIAGITNSKAFSLEVVAFVDTEKPIVNVTHNASSTINPGQTVTFVVTVDDNVGVESLEFTINGTKLAIGADGRVNYQFTALGSYAIKAIAVDAAGNIGVKEFTLSVAEYTDTEAPTVSIAADKTSLTEGGTVNFTIISDDNVGVTKLTLTINGQSVSIDANGKASYIFSSMGTYTALVTAEDAAGNTAVASIEIKVASVNDVKAPTVSISGPASNSTITNTVAITGTIADVDSPEVFWTVSLKDLAGITKIVATGSGKFSNEIICELNPARFSNGTYTLIVTAEDPAGHTASASRQIKILSEYKMGSFELPVADVSVNMGGFTLDVVRRYNGENASYKGDFGYGWDLEYQPVSLQTDLKADPRSNYWDSLNEDCGFRVGTKVMITLPDGSAVTFTAQSTGGLLSTSMYFVSDRAGYSLSLAGATGLRLSDDGQQRFIVSGFPYNPQSPFCSYRNAPYTLSTPDGTTYSIDSTTGLATEVRNAKNERVVISKSGFVAYDNGGKMIGEVKFERDSQNRITAIVDPEGNRVTYEYDVNGDLVAVTNREGEKTVYSYVNASGLPKHHLQSITDARGVTSMFVEYDFATGHILKIVDGSGNPMSMGYTSHIGNGLTAESISDALGNMIETVRDSKGNAVRAIRHTYNENGKSYIVTEMRYDNNGKMTRESRAHTITEVELDSSGESVYTYAPNEIVWKIVNTYDTRGNLIASIDMYGQETRYTYDSKGNVLTVTDGFGNTTTNKYNNQSLLTESTGPTGVKTRYTYDGKGRLTLSEKVYPDETVVVVQQTEYDSAGRVIKVIDGTGTVTENKYNSIGKRIEIKVSVVDKNDPSITHTDTTYTEYDKEGRVITTWQVTDGVEVARITNEYNALGAVVGTTNINNLRTETIYDALNRKIEERVQTIDENGATVWLVTRFVFDAAGRLIWDSDQHVEFDPGSIQQASWATRIIYDELGREVRRERRCGVVLSVDTVGAAPAGTLVTDGELISYTERGYNASNEALWHRNESGALTVNVYTPEGAIDYVITDIDGDLSTMHDQTAGGKVIYDEYGREIGKVLDLDGDILTESDQIRTSYEYDLQGNIVKTTYGDGTTTEAGYDALNRKIFETDQYGNKTYFEYDEKGNLTAVVLPKVKHPDTGMMVHVRYEYAYDAAGNHISLKDNLYQTDPLDSATIDSSAVRTTLFAYDWKGNQTGRTLPNGFQEFCVYDSKGQMIRHTSFEGRVTTIEYDILGRVVAQRFYSSEATWSDGGGISEHMITYVYNAFGSVIREENSKTGTTSTEYDDLNRVTRVESLQGIVNYEYDSFTGQISRTWTGQDPSDPITDVWNTYDALGRLQTVSTLAREGSVLENHETTQYIYDIIGNIERIVQANGVISEHEYDVLNRLKAITHYAPDATPETLADNAILQSYSYDYHWNGNRSKETFTDVDGSTHTWEWVYDAIGRLVKEVHDNYLDNLDYSTEYAYDLVGNRLKKITDTGNDGSIDEVIVSEFDQNDRLLNEKKILNDVQTQFTEYKYNKTEQIAKVVTDLVNSRYETITRMDYDLQGRMCKIVIETYVEDKLAKTVIQEYLYDSSGIKIRQTESVDDNADGVADSEKVTDYVNVQRNHTGYSQVLEEYESVGGQTVKITTYAIGHDVLAQFSALNGLLTLLSDGHGSTRAVADPSGQVIQEYNYDAYGNAHGFDPSEALTNILYSGEQFNPVSGLQYLRARWYNPQTGTFNRLDPFSGDKGAPLSFHKYAYAHMNPVMNTDPSGFYSVAGMYVSAGLQMIVRTLASIGLGNALVNVAGAACTFLLITKFHDIYECVSYAAAIAGEAMDVMWAKTKDALDKAVEAVGDIALRLWKHFGFFPVYEAATPYIWSHTIRAQSAGYPVVLTYGGHTRAVLATIRGAALNGLFPAGEDPTLGRLSWDEYPYASTLEGKQLYDNQKQPSVEKVPLYENCAQGTMLAMFYATRITGSKFSVLPVPYSGPMYPKL